MDVGDLAALAVMMTGLAFGAVLIGRLLDRVERVIKLVETWQSQVREDCQRLDQRIDETHRMLGRLGVIDGGRGGRP